VGELFGVDATGPADAGALHDWAATEGIHEMTPVV
jgi:hypothetical protein